MDSRAVIDLFVRVLVALPFLFCVDQFYLDFFLYRIVFPVLGIWLITVDIFLSKSLVFYYGVAMAIGVFLVKPMLFYELAIYLLIFFVFLLFFLEGDGIIDINIELYQFVSWSIRLIASALILQSSMDPVMYFMGWIYGILISSNLRKSCRRNYVVRFFKNLSQIDTSYLWGSRIKGPYDSRTFKTYLNDIASTGCPLKPRRLDTFYSTFHNTCERKKISKDEWDKITKETTKKAMQELVSSPAFSEWAVAHADRFTLARQRRWYQWLRWLVT